MSLRKLKIEDTYDSLDLIIIEALGKLGPRNIYGIAKYLGLPESTVRHRINKLRKRGILYLSTNIYHTNLGLKKAVVYADVNPHYTRYIHDFLELNDYWVYTKSLFSLRNCVFALYTIPVTQEDKFIVFLNELVNLGIIERYDLKWSTCFHRVNTTTKWFDLDRCLWKFDWNALMEEMEKADTALPVTLKDPAKWIIKADKVDVYILKELEKDATVPLTEISKKLGMTVQNLHYHYKHHIIPNFLIEGFEIAFLKFGVKDSLVPYMDIKFRNYSAMAKFANAIRDKPFVEVLGKILGTNALFLNAYLPTHEFFNFIGFLNRLIETGWIKSYKCWLSHISLPGKRQTIPYKNFAGNYWIYDHEKYINDIYRLKEKVDKVIKSHVNF